MYFLTGKLPLTTMHEVCHMLRLQLTAGLTLRDAFRRLATSGSGPLRPVAERIKERLEQGESLADALQPEQRRFPPMFTAMVSVGEETGRLVEVLHELEKYFREQLRCRRLILARSIMPVLQFIAALGIIALLIVILDVIAQSNHSQSAPILGFRGTRGAMMFLLLNAVIFAGLYVAYCAFKRREGRQAFLDAVLWRVPVLGPFIRALVMNRFTLAMQLTLDSSMPIAKALRLAFQATGNQAFAQQSEGVAQAVKQGQEITTALGRGWLLPRGFLDMVAIGEEGGNLVEIMRHQAAQYQEEAFRRMEILSRVATGAVWFAYATFMVGAIFSIARIYIGALHI
jgi:type II secretory pathway component PulF